VLVIACMGVTCAVWMQGMRGAKYGGERVGDLAQALASRVQRERPLHMYQL
jgi:hypothetical protein